MPIQEQTNNTNITIKHSIFLLTITDILSTITNTTIAIIKHYTGEIIFSFQKTSNNTYFNLVPKISLHCITYTRFHIT